jgi:hypothetical protein
MLRLIFFMSCFTTLNNPQTSCFNLANNISWTIIFKLKWNIRILNLITWSKWFKIRILLIIQIRLIKRLHRKFRTMTDVHEIRFPCKMKNHDKWTRGQGPNFFSRDKVAQTLKRRAFSCTNLDTEFITMNCSIPFRSSPLLPLLSSPVQKPQWKAQRLLWSSSKEPARIAKHNQKMTARTRAVAESLILGVASEPRPRDVSVLLQTGLVIYAHTLQDWFQKLSVYLYGTLTPVNYLVRITVLCFC